MHYKSSIGEKKFNRRSVYIIIKFTSDLHQFSLDLYQIMEMERVTEFPMSNVDIGPRKRQRIGWDVVHPAAFVATAIETYD
ncbi:putative dual-specificity kinase [Helianthus anomalus]